MIDIIIRIITVTHRQSIPKSITIQSYALQTLPFIARITTPKKIQKVAILSVSSEAILSRLQCNNNTR